MKSEKRLSNAYGKNERTVLMKIRVLCSSIILTLGAIALLAVSSDSVFSQTAPTKTTQAFQELFDYSQKEKKA
jgi:hypothetical protein